MHVTQAFVLCFFCLLSEVAAPTGSASQELSAYRRSQTACEGEEASLAAKVGLDRYHAWATAYDLGQTPPKNAFGEAGQAFAHLYDKLGCRDPLVVYWFGNLLRHNKKYDRAIQIMSESLAGIETHYAELMTTVLGSLGQACVSAGRHQEAIAYYRRVITMDPDDVSMRLNLGHQLYHQGDIKGAREQALAALELPLSEYGRSVAEKLLEKTRP